MDSKDVTITHQHGKSKVRVARVWREGARHYMVEWNVDISIVSDCEEAFTKSDNSRIVATDTMKNTVYVVAKQCTQRCSVEEFGLKLGKHMLDNYGHVSAVKIWIKNKPWGRASSGGLEHDHSFDLYADGSGIRTAELYMTRSGTVEVKGGVEELTLLKTTQSGFDNFYRCKYTTLGDTRERIVASSIKAVWSYSTTRVNFDALFAAVKRTLTEELIGPAKGGVYSVSVQQTLHDMAKAVLDKYPFIESCYLNMPNLHFVPVKIPFVPFNDDVYVPTSEPHGNIEAEVRRTNATARSKL